ncbi:probable LRR receptor-like serine/threonine-protein kinase At1g07650 isoform X3 [Arachis hypogaea]|uniref:probable LRR receptor-like serine/threonine-protein kinase At1g07650 isoform X3 n=1 Tax=Arachis hypogaea TaxID=3818 RepID=UPI000DEC784B|nr:probable leucine-rich repeat receptor-like serine/threonine-protein kinase At3g14840 isoform X3 [Arachis hypogaea]
MKMMITTSSKLFFFSSFLALCFMLCPTEAASRLPDTEVEALKQITKTLDWDLKNIDPCSVGGIISNPVRSTSEIINVSCDCSIANDNFCHIITIILSAQNLQGKLPPELVKLPYLQEINLTRNYLSGTIPREWGTMNLTKIALVANGLSGEIPKELANITTLKTLSLEFNNFYGNLSVLGSLPHLEILDLTSNNFTGELPETFSNLITLKELRLGDNQFSGKIPNFIQKWTGLENLVIQGSGFTGPIPSEISYLLNLEDLRISDLNGPQSKFPPLDNMTNLGVLILRSCNINDTIPNYLGNFKNLKTLDLSYNKLGGEIPESLTSLSSIKYIYLTGNILSGQVPADWTAPIDLSYNNFTNSPQTVTCQTSNMNLFASFAKGNNTGPLSCGQSKEKCPKYYYSFHINCGGDSNVQKGRIIYESDSYKGVPFKKSRAESSNWAISTTGVDFMDNVHQYDLIQENETKLDIVDDADLYTKARGSPISLTYYGFCLANGNYTVNLHFAEIVFINGTTYKSLGRRIFDVYIQGERVLKDFNIAKEAKGIGKANIQNLSAYVSNNELEIRLYWAGKDSLPKHNHISTRLMAGIVAPTVIVIILIICLLWWKGCLRKKTSLEKELRNLDLQTGLFSLHQIKAATNNFNISNKIGEGGFGPVYKGILPNGTIIAVKQLSSKSKQGNREFINEIAMISALQHPCLVKLYGCCVEGDQLLLIYEYMENNSLAYALFGNKENQLKLNWPTRQKICVGIARGLAFLHEESRLKIVHRDIKATNVLLDKNLNPKISDFGLAKLHEEDATHISTRIAGTYGYMAPEYAMNGYLTDKADVYSFGIVVLELVSGKANTIHRSKEEVLYLLDWAHLLKEKGMLMELVDRRLGSDFNEEEVMVMIQVALLCTNATANLRPSMSSVLSMLEGKIIVPEFVSDQSELMDEMKLEAMRQYYYQKEENKINEANNNVSHNVVEEQWIASSSSDLYPMHIDSSSYYWEQRN